MPRLQQADQLHGVRLGVAMFEDRREGVSPTDPETRAYIARRGAWRFGLTYKGKDFVPVADLVQSIFVEEFVHAGIDTIAIPQVLGKGAGPAMRAAGEQAGVGYVLGGYVNVFEFALYDQFWYIESARSVVLEIQLVRVRDGESLLDTAASATDRGSEGMATTIPSNVDQLLNRAFRLVIYQVVDQVAAKLAMNPRNIEVHIAVLEP